MGRRSRWAGFWHKGTILYQLREQRWDIEPILIPHHGRASIQHTYDLPTTYIIQKANFIADLKRHIHKRLAPNINVQAAYSMRFGTAKVRKFAVIIERDGRIILYTVENLIIGQCTGMLPIAQNGDFTRDRGHFTLPKIPCSPSCECPPFTLHPPFRAVTQ
jgi:hypothetical protein